MVTLTVLNNNKSETPVVDNNGQVIDNPEDPVVVPGDTDEPVVTEPVIVFSSPVANSTVGKGFSNTVLVWSSTLNQYQTHEGMDFFADAGSQVKAVKAGTVHSVTSDPLNGKTVTVSHGDGLYTVYCSLSDVAVSAGQAVTTETVLGLVSTSLLSEAGEGAHLHFEVLENAVKVDPADYFVAEEK
jgi:murein DD-endopeptidase MepM/ murein hydrolase activator NlpD